MWIACGRNAFISRRMCGTGPDGQPDLRVARRRDAQHSLRRYDADLVAQPREGVDGGFEGGDYAIGLRCPGVGCNCRFSRCVRKERRRRRRAGDLHAVRPAQQLQLAVVLFNQGGAGLNPVTGVAVERAVDVLQVRAVDVAADHAVVALLPGVSRGNVLELRDVADADGDAELDALGHRPVRRFMARNRLLTL